MTDNELILVIPRQKIGAFLNFRGFKPVSGEPVDEWLKESSFQDRPTMETDPSFQQIIPYILLRHNDLVFRYCRTKKGGEARLHDMYSIGIGGHINPIDESGSSGDIIMKAAMRELEEEMHITQDVKLEHIGYINDDESEVGKVHLGFVMQAWLENPDAAVREDALSKGEWVKQDKMLDGNEYETWSQLIIEGYLQQGGIMSERGNYPRLSRYKTPEAFRERLAELNLDLPVDDELIKAEDGSPLAQPVTAYGKTMGNRWCVHPMEGWDGTPDGKPTEHTLRRWRNFGLSGAKLIFGGEAVAVRHDGRANPNQVTAKPENKDGIASLRTELVNAHQEAYGTSDDLFVGLQLTHSGRFCRPDQDHKLKPRILYHHPVLDKKFGIDPNDDSVVFSDAEIDDLITYYIKAAKMAEDTGYEFVDVKHCHGYLGHEFLSSYTREGNYGGSFENRTRFLRTIVEGIRKEAPSLHIALRLSAFDFIPYRDDEATRKGIHKGFGIPEEYEHCLPYKYGFSVNQDNPLEMNLAETYKFLDLLQELNIEIVNLTCGSPYYNPHIQRPAYFPPSDGYRPPEDPLVGVARQIHAVKEVKAKFPNLAIVGTGYSYLQEFLPLVAQAVVREGWVDIIGYGRGILSYPELPADSLAGKVMDKKRVCRTFSDCTTAPRNHMISGCFPLDDYYKDMPENKKLKELKAKKA